MTIPSLPVRALVSARFPEQNPQGREQEGYRPAIVVGIPKRLGIPRYQLVILLPMTTDRGQEWAKASPELYPRLAAGIAGLRKPSLALLDFVLWM